MWVNSEKYIFSDHIISGGLALHSQFESVVKLITVMYKSCQDTYDFLSVESLNAEMP